MYTLFGYYDILDKEGFLIPVFMKDNILYNGVTHQGYYIDFKPFSGSIKKNIEAHIIEKVPNVNSRYKVTIDKEVILLYKTTSKLYYNFVSKLRLQLNKKTIKSNIEKNSSRYYDLMCFLGLYDEALNEGESIGYNKDLINEYYSFDKTMIDFNTALDYFVSLKPKNINIEDYFGYTNNTLFFGLYFFETTNMTKKQIIKKFDIKHATNDIEKYILIKFKIFLEHALIVSDKTIPKDLIVNEII